MNVEGSCGGDPVLVLSFLMLQPLNTVPHVMVTPNQKTILLLLHNCNLVKVLNCNVNI